MPRHDRDPVLRGRHGGYGDYGRQDYAAHREHPRSSSATRSREFRDYGRGDYRGNVGPEGLGYSDANYGPTRFSEDQRRNRERAGHEAPDATGGGGIHREFGQFDQSGPGRRGQSYRGQGPRNYTRSDERIRELICERLTDDPAVDASDVTIDVRPREVVLQGAVPDRWMKHRVEDIAGEYVTGKEIRNELRVSR